MLEQQNISKYYLENDHSYPQYIYSSIFYMKKKIIQKTYYISLIWKPSVKKQK